MKEPPDAAGEVALEAADRFAGGLALGASAGDVVAGGLVAAGAGDDHAVQGSVDLAVAALIEPLALRVARARGDRRDAGGASELGRGREALSAAMATLTEREVIAFMSDSQLKPDDPVEVFVLVASMSRS